MFSLVDSELNDEQIGAINQDGNVFLIACPGSGKTRTLAYKIAHELTKIDANRQYVVAITYTNRAADEIQDRVERLGISTTQLWIGTIHSFCLEWILKPYSNYHDELKSGFRVIDPHDSEKILTDLCVPYKSQKISYWDCGYYFKSDGYHLTCNNHNKHEHLQQIIHKYFDILFESKQIDFELILYYAHQILVDNAPISVILSNIFKYILVDEYQDTKEIQYNIIAMILKGGNDSTRLFMVGDPNQSIFGSFGGYPIDPEELKKLSNIELAELSLSRNYRSSSRIVGYFGKYNVFDTKIEAYSDCTEYPSLITYDRTVTKNELENKLVELIVFNIEAKGIEPSEICITGPQWVHLAAITRRLVNRLPQYNFDGPGMVPFGRDFDNFWYKLCRIVLTEPSPSIYIRRMRWAKEVLSDLNSVGAPCQSITAKQLLRECNSISISEKNGLDYLRVFFEILFGRLGIDFNSYASLKEHHTSFFESSQERINRLIKEGAEFISDISTFKRVFKPREGITVQTNHGIKGAEFDTIIAFALLEGMVPHFSDLDGEINAEKMLYVICSRARKNLHLISERGRLNGFKKEYQATNRLKSESFNYDECLC